MMKIVLSPLYWIKALNLSRNGANVEAYEYLKKISAKSVKKNFRFFLLKAYIETVLQQFDDALVSVEEALRIIENLKSQNKISLDDYNYLKKYALITARMCYRMLDNYKKLEDTTKRIKTISFNINNVSPRLLDLFPQKN